MNNSNGKVVYINGPVIRAEEAQGLKMREMVLVGRKKLIGEVVSIQDTDATIQVYEETSGLQWGEDVISTGKPLSVKLGPGIISNIFDGIERPLERINEAGSAFIPEGIGLISIDENELWDVHITAKENDFLEAGTVYATVQETSVVLHKLMVPPNVGGKVVFAESDGKYNIEQVVIRLETDTGEQVELKLYQEWPVRTPRPVGRKMGIVKPLITGQRVIDTFFPIAKGGTAAIPGGFGTGKTITQHQLAKWSDADIIVYIGCGERGNEMTEVLEEFPGIIDPRNDKSIMERTVLIANTSNMPVAAREASIYTGIAIAEYFRDMGYHIAIMADSTSRWAEALREISARLEEMPAEEGYPAYLPSRLAQFYERAGYAETLSGEEGSVTIIGAVSPAGGDYSEPVTQNTRRVTSTFLALDKALAYARHFPAINWHNSYSGYVSDLTEWYQQNIAEDMMELRGKMLSLLQEEKKLLEIVKLVGEDILPDDQRLILEIAKVVKVGYLQQNAYHKDDSNVTLMKQYKMLKVIEHLYDEAYKCVKLGAPISKLKDEDLFYSIITMKYNVTEENLEKLDEIIAEIDKYYGSLESKYSKGGENNEA